MFERDIKRLGSADRLRPDACDPRLAKRPPRAASERLILHRLRPPGRPRRPLGSAGLAGPAGLAGSAGSVGPADLVGPAEIVGFADPVGPAGTVGPAVTERVAEACASRLSTRPPTTASSRSSRTYSCLTTSMSLPSSSSDSSELGRQLLRKF